MIADPIERVGAALELATRLVDQIEWVDVYEELLSQQTGQPVREGQQFTQDVSAWLLGPRMRDVLKRTIDAIAQRIKTSPLGQRALAPDELDCAGELLTCAIRGLIKATDPRNAWVLKRRLIIKFTTIEVPWIQDPLPTQRVLDAEAAGRPIEPE